MWLGYLFHYVFFTKVQLHSEYVPMSSSDLSINKCILRISCEPDEDQEVEETGPQSRSLQTLTSIQSNVTSEEDAMKIVQRVLDERKVLSVWQHGQRVSSALGTASPQVSFKEKQSLSAWDCIENKLTLHPRSLPFDWTQGGN